MFFHGDRDYLERMLPVGEARMISGKVEVFDGKRQMTHPDHIVPVTQAHQLLPSLAWGATVQAWTRKARSRVYPDPIPVPCAA